MTLKSYLWGMRISTLLTFIAWLLVIWYVDPEKTGLAGQLLFFVSSGLFFSGLFILFFTWLRRKVSGEDGLVFAYLGVSFRQGILLALLGVILLIFQEHRILTWWDSALVIAGMFLVELYFLTRR